MQIFGLLGMNWESIQADALFIIVVQPQIHRAKTILTTREVLWWPELAKRAPNIVERLVPCATAEKTRRAVRCRLEPPPAGLIRAHSWHLCACLQHLLPC